jgi:acyl-lipid omega-6 desaturase (Delta-12 desaturase)
VSTLALYLVWWLAMARAASASVWLPLAMAPVGALLLVRTFVLQHDLGHGTLLPSRTARDSVGLVLGVLTLTPYYYWRWTHALHHRDFNKLEHRSDVGYFLTLTVAEYRKLTPRGQLLYRLYRNPWLFFLVGAVFQFFIKHRFPWDTPWSKRKEWLSVGFTNTGLVVLFAAVGWKTLLLVQLPIWLFTTWLGVWLFYLQHTVDPGYMKPKAEWDLTRACLLGSSFYDLPQPLRWFTGHIGLHHVHHLCPMIPNYALEAARVATPSLAAVAPMSIAQSFARVRLKLWDESQGSFSGYPEVPQAVHALEPAPEAES